MVTYVKWQQPLISKADNKALNRTTTRSQAYQSPYLNRNVLDNTAILRSPVSLSLCYLNEKGDLNVKKIMLIALVSTLFAGCASVPMEGIEKPQKHKSSTLHRKEILGYTSIVLVVSAEL